MFTQTLRKRIIKEKGRGWRESEIKKKIKKSQVTQSGGNVYILLEKYKLFALPLKYLDLTITKKIFFNYYYYKEMV